MISDETPILTVVISEIILGEALKFAPHFNKTSAQAELCYRAETCFENNKIFRKRIKSKNGREYMHSFMRHWLAAHLLKNGVSRETIPLQWSNGKEP